MSVGVKAVANPAKAVVLDKVHHRVIFLSSELGARIHKGAGGNHPFFVHCVVVATMVANDDALADGAHDTGVIE